MIGPIEVAIAVSSGFATVPAMIGAPLTGTNSGGNTVPVTIAVADG